MFKCGHKLPVNDKTTVPTDLLFFDTETINTSSDNIFDKHKAYYIYGVYINTKWTVKQSEEYSGSNYQDFYKWLTSKVRKNRILHVFGHNVKFDIISTNGIFHMMENGYKVNFYWENGISSMFNFHNQELDTKIKFINTANYVQSSLANLGKSMGIEKLDFDYSKAKNFCKIENGEITDIDTYHEDYKEMEIYCKRDVKIVQYFILSFINFIKVNDLGKFSLTSASQAMHAYRHRFMKEIFFHKDEDLKHCERLSYKGGRVSLFRRGNFTGTDVYYLDINSMYPYVMSTSLIPYKLIGHEYDVSIKRFTELSSQYFVIAKIKGKLKNPCLSIRVSGKICYPVGDFIDYLTLPEIKLLEENGELFEIEHIIYYEQDYIFRDYVAYFYSLRQQYKEQLNFIFETISKLFLNSLYGKFAQKQHNNEFVGSCDPFEVETKEIYDLENNGEMIIERRFGGNVFYEKADIEHDRNFIAIASSITAYARCLLWKIIEKAGLENLYYCDTDSVFVNKDGYDRLQSLISKTELGKLKFEGVANNYEVYAPKYYVFNGKMKIKGLNKLSTHLHDNVHETKTFIGFNSHVKIGDISQYHVRNGEKEIFGNYYHGYHMKDNRVEPLQCSIENNQNKIIIEEKEILNNIAYLRKYWYNEMKGEDV